MPSALRSGGILPVAIGTLAWLIALPVTIVMGGAWENPWAWTCIVGIVSGVIGMRWLARRWQRLRQSVSDSAVSDSAVSD